ncbi:MAG: gamma-glutamyl-phosphate reductase, partial [Acidobacteria bacterium]|nr:gamma-glutamyl-phosphate reductase [Acidobacteriota bacterium]
MTEVLAPADVETAVHAIADRAKTASRELARANRALKDQALLAIAAALTEHEGAILDANAVDVQQARDNGISGSMLDRLTLTTERVAALSAALENLATLPDPVGSVVRGQTLPNGLRLRQINVPLGVVA